MTTGLTSAFPHLAMPGISRGVTEELRFWHIDSSEPPPAQGTFVALVPGTDAVVHTVSLPSSLKGKAREEVAIRQVRDRLNARPGALRLLPMRLSGCKDSWSSVLVAGAEAATEWRKHVSSAETRCRAILPDYLALPIAPGLWTVATSSTSGRTIVQVRLGPADGFTAEAELAAFALARARSTRPRPEAVLRMGPAEPEVEAALDGLPLSYSLRDLPKAQASAGVLLRGEETLALGDDPPRQDASLAGWLRRCLWPLALIAVGLAAWGISVEVETQRYRAEADMIREEVITAVRRDFLPEGPIVDMRVQVGREMDRLRMQAAGSLPATGLLERFRLISSVMADRDDLVVLSTVLREGEGISIDVSVPDFIVLDRVNARLREAEPGMRMLRSATEAGGRVVGTFFIPLEDGSD